MSDPEEIGARLARSLDKPVTDMALPLPSRAQRALRPLRRLKIRAQDAFYGRDVDSSKPEVHLDHFHPDRVNYQPSGWRYLHRVLHKRDVGPDDVLVDFGSGKGRVVYRAAHYPFRRVIGIEISEALTAVAQQNIDRNRDRLRCQDIELVTADVLDFEIPDDMTVAYFYHPFAGETFRLVIERIVESLDRAPRRLRVVYACPALEDVLLATGGFRVERRSRGGLRDQVNLRVTMYVHEPAEAG